MSRHTPRKRGFGYALARIFVALLGLLVGFGLYIWHYLGVVDYRPIDIVDRFIPSRNADETVQESGQATDAERVYIHDDYPVRKVEQKDPDIRNILVFGVDGETTDAPSRTDSLMILTLDRGTRSMRLTSIMRDTEMRLDTADEFTTKINAAYVHGGVGLLINTLNTRLDLDIQEYMMFDFWSSADAVDAVGGIEITVEPDELENLNSIIGAMNRLFDDPEDSDLVANPGTQMLNGKQAISWSRIRYVGTDFARTQRQRTVVTAMVQKASRMNPLQQIGVGRELLDETATNLTRWSIVDAAYTALGGIDSIQQYRVPEDGLYQTNQENWNMIVDWDTQIPRLHRFIWEGETP